MTDIALNVGEGPTKLFITWDTRGDEGWVGNEYVQTICQHLGIPLKNFAILTSANSTNGVDGDWEIALQVTNNPVMSRGVEIDFKGKSWFRIMSAEKVQMFSDFIHARFPAFTPAMIRGGVGCLNTSNIMDAFSIYMDNATNVKYWAIEMGTNDAWGGSKDNLQIFTRNMQTIIDSAKAHGITPIIARIMATNPAVAKWQVHPDYVKAIDDLVEKNNLPQGPDFYNHFLNHPEELIATNGDGVHPMPSGAQSMHRLWAEAVAPLYAASDAAGIGAAQVRNIRFAVPQISVVDKSIRISGMDSDASVSIVNPMGQVMQNTGNLPSGNYMAVARSHGHSVTAKVHIK